MITEAASTQADVDRVKSADTTIQPGDVALMLADLPLKSVCTCKACSPTSTAGWTSEV